MRWAVALLAMAVVVPAHAQTVSGPPSAASVTIYRDRNLTSASRAYSNRLQGLALITETRTVEAPTGMSRIIFRDVADTIVPETVAIQGLPGVIVERNEDYDLLSPGSLVARSTGRTVQVVRTDPKSGAVTQRPAVIRSGPNGVVLETDGKIQALGCGGLPERLIFDKVPDGLGDKATLSMLANVPKAGRYIVTLSYLATGFAWSADYVARIRPDGRTLDLSGWLTLDNQSSATFAQAPTQVVAGDLMRDGATQPVLVTPQYLAPACWGQPQPPPPALQVPGVFRRMAAPEIQEMVLTGSKVMAVQSDVGDYKLYALPGPTTVAARQTKQVAFLDQHAVPFDRVYVYRHQPFTEQDISDPSEPEAPQVVLRLQNKAEVGLGKPLPAGTVSAIQPSPDGPVFAGQAEIDDTPVGLPLELSVGRATDLMVSTRITRDHSTDDLRDRDYEVTVVNAKAQPVTFELRERPIGQDFQIRNASRPFASDRGDNVLTLRLAPGEQARVTFEAIYSY